MTALHEHYDGLIVCMCHFTEAIQSLENLHYRQEQLFLFEKYITGLQSAFNILDDNTELRSEKEKICLMVKDISTNNAQVQAAMFIIAMDNTLNVNFNASCNKLSEQISIIFPKANLNSRNYRVKDIQAARGRAKEKIMAISKAKAIQEEAKGGMLLL